MSLPGWCYLRRTRSYHWQIHSRDAPCWLNKEVATLAEPTWQGMWATPGGGGQPPAKIGQEAEPCLTPTRKQTLPTTCVFESTFISFWLTSLCMAVSRSIHFSTNHPNNFFLWLSNIPLYMCTTSSLSIHLLIIQVTDIVQLLCITLADLSFITHTSLICSAGLLCWAAEKVQNRFIYSYPSNIYLGNPQEILFN